VNYVIPLFLLPGTLDPVPACCVRYSIRTRAGNYPEETSFFRATCLKRRKTCCKDSAL